MHRPASHGASYPITSDMVAGLVENLGLNRQTTSELRFTKSKLKPREGVTKVWADELQDVLLGQGCSNLLLEDAPPSLLSCRKKAPTADNQVLEALLQGMIAEWLSENTRFYHVVRGSLDIGGPMQDADLSLFHEQFCQGDERDGRGLYLWAIGFKSHTTVSAQSALIARVESAKLAGGAPSLVALEVHCCGLLTDWVRVTGNHLGEPAGFYFRLLRSMSGAPDGSKLSMLHQWVANKVSDDDALLKTPAELIRRLVAHGETLGLPVNGAAVTVLSTGGGGERRNDCGLCPARLCSARKAGGGVKNCLCFNPGMAIPARQAAKGNATLSCSAASILR